MARQNRREKRERSRRMKRATEIVGPKFTEWLSSLPEGDRQREVDTAIVNNARIRGLRVLEVTCD